MDSSDMAADWEHFLNMVGSRYGLDASETVEKTGEAVSLPNAEPQTAPETAPKMPVQPPRPRVRKPLSAAARRGVLIAAALAAVLVLGLGIRTAVVQFGTRIPENVCAAGVELGGMSRAQARKALRAAAGQTYDVRELEITLPDTTLQLTPGQTGVRLEIGALAASARRADAGQMDLLPYLSLNEEALRGLLEDYAQQAAQRFVPSQVTLVGAVPALEEGDFSEAVPCPKLELTVGNPGYALDVEKLYGLIQSAYADGSFAVDAQSAVTPLEPEKLDLQQIREQVCIAPVDARMDPQTHKPIPGSYGLGFDEKAVRSQLSKAGNGDTLEIALCYLAPEVVGQEVYFQDILGFCETPHSNNEKRTNNLRLACAALNGVVLQPGDTLSYNDTLGRRTAENGYQPAPAYSGTGLVDNIGGGICQVSSTLYLCSLYAELETVERVNHGFPVSYIPYGLDATVNWGAPDLKIRNDSEYPVKIVAEVADNFVRIWLMGTETRDYYIRMGFGSSGNYARSYVCKYDRATDEQISREQHFLSGYINEITSLRGEIGMDEAYINTNVRKQEPCEPTQETLAASRNYRQPNLNAE